MPSHLGHVDWTYVHFVAIFDAPDFASGHSYGRRDKSNDANHLGFPRLRLGDLPDMEVCGLS